MYSSDFDDGRVVGAMLLSSFELLVDYRVELDVSVGETDTFSLATSLERT